MCGHRCDTNVILNPNAKPKPNPNPNPIPNLIPNGILNPNPKAFQKDKEIEDEFQTKQEAGQLGWLHE